MTMSFKERAERYRELRAERERALAAGWVGTVQRIDSELAELMDEHIAASRHRPVRLLPDSLLIEELRRGIAHYESRGDFDRACELRAHLVELEYPHKVRARGAVQLIRPER